MSGYEIVCSGLDEVRIEYEDGEVWEPEDKKVKKEIKRTKEKKKKEAEESGTDFFNGPLVRVKSSTIDSRGGRTSLYLELEDTNYFSHVGTRDKRYDKENRADPLSVGARVIFPEEYILLGEKSSLNEIGSGEFQIPAGYVEDLKAEYGNPLDPNPLTPIEREIKEETGLAKEKFNKLEPQDLIKAVEKQPMLVYNARTEASIRNAEKRWKRIEDSEKEFSRLAFLRVEDIGKALEDKVKVKLTSVHPDDKDRLVREYTNKKLDLRPHAEGALEAYYQKLK